MDRNVTQNQLIKFIYGELSFDETSKLYDQLDSDSIAMQELEMLLEAKSLLSTLKYSPSIESIDSIMAYSAEIKAV